MELFRKFLELSNFSIEEAWTHQWPSYKKAMCFDTEANGYVLCCAVRFDTDEIIELSISDDDGNGYRWLNPSYKEAIFDECKDRDIDFKNGNLVDLEITDDFFEKASAMISGKEFDKRIVIPLDLDEKELFLLMKEAHERDITFNEMCELCLKTFLEEHGVG